MQLRLQAVAVAVVLAVLLVAMVSGVLAEMVTAETEPLPTEDFG